MGQSEYIHEGKRRLDFIDIKGRRWRYLVIIPAKHMDRIVSTSAPQSSFPYCILDAFILSTTNFIFCNFAMFSIDGVLG